MEKFGDTHFIFAIGAGAVTRRKMLALAGTAVLAMTMQSAVMAGGLDKSDIQLVTVIQTNTNPYMLQWAAGSQAFADSVGLPLKTIVSNGDSQQQLAQIQATIAAGKKVVVTINPINSADVPAIVKAVTRSGGFITTQWNKPEGYNPWDVSPNYVAHLTYDGYSAGKWTGKSLFTAMGGKGGIIAFKGVLDSPPSKQRYDGMNEALKDFPDVKILDTQAAGWDRQKAYDITKTLLTKYGDQIKGVWAASDSMTLGAYAAFQDAGRVGEVKFSGNDNTEEALKLIDSGPNFIDTYSSDGYYNGALGLAMAYDAAIGKLDVSKLTHEQRAGNYSQFGVDKSNVKQQLKPPTGDEIMAEVKKGLFARFVGPELK
ncbi:monosaccharide ABC transporter substrate-binding protein, CUT2 family [Bradyrhizobium sp. Rc2d]|uniref:sugar ABC transporter substrate-binding protein n=1 Tax=Bradyrhizobium sp. Rc2d TaxID=1855321 RepID=UPI00088DDE16|nr:sugar ABC transporter substrate-binding protein [Bradyrhizobium sp. Rc2d]SDG71197.1 monosaccharide ABC transporter substrate-binding protein, CUT2 family [Bradyrhizobium sp. Rc2d]